VGTFKKKPEIVDARQFNGGVQNASSLILWIESGVGRAILVEETDERFERVMVDEALNKWVPAYVGDWVVRHQNGSFEVVRPLTFEFDYTQV
jgi:hypothetical protein